MTVSPTPLFNKRDFLLKLPDAKQRLPTKKRYAGEPDLTRLKPQQMRGFEELSNFVQSDAKMFLLSGVAGTGKTYLINTCIEWLLWTKRTVKVAMTAPTNKAVKVLRRSAQYSHTNLDFLTCHKLLGLKEQVDEHTGEQVFRRDYNSPCKLEQYDYLVIDEVSMLPDEIFAMLEEFVLRGLKIIFMGDPCQIPPIGRLNCIPLDPEMRAEYNIGNIHLDEIIRQGAGSPIIDTTFEIREAMNFRTPIRTRETRVTDQGAVVFLNSRDDGYLLEELLGRYFTSENFKQDSDFVKIIAWRNTIIDKMNNVVRNIIYGNTTKLLERQTVLEKIKIAEKLIAHKPIMEGIQTLFNTNDEMEVMSFSVESEDINGDGKYVIKYYNAVVKSLEEDNTEHTIRIVHEDSEKLVENILDLLRQYAASQVRGTVSFKKAWEQYYEFIGKFAQVKYAYAITAHRAQGSTYHTTIVIESDIDQSNNILERNKIKYTACSRASHLLIII